MPLRSILISCHRRLRLARCLFPQSFLTKTLHPFLITPTCATSPPLSVPNFITLMLFGVEVQITTLLSALLFLVHLRTKYSYMITDTCSPTGSTLFDSCFGRKWLFGHSRTTGVNILLFDKQRTANVMQPAHHPIMFRG
jgi:hypothetical protein